MKLSKKQEKEILKKQKENGSISAEDFSNIAKNKIKDKTEQTKKINKNRVSRIKDTLNELEVLEFNTKPFFISLKIRHLSYNFWNSLHLQSTISIKNKIKEFIKDQTFKYYFNKKDIMIENPVKIKIDIFISHKNKMDLDNIAIVSLIIEKMIVDIYKGIIIQDDNQNYISGFELNFHKGDIEKLNISFEEIIQKG